MRVPAMSLVSLGAVLLTAGCAVGSPRESPIRPTPIPEETRPPTAAATATSPATAPSPSASAKPVATGTPSATNPPGSTPSPSTGPPVAFLRGGDAPIAGWLGSFCWKGLCGDVPQVAPKAQLPTLSFASDDLELVLAADAPFVRWFASYGADARTLEPLADGGSAFDPDAVSASPPPQLTAATFAPPPSGDWVLTVQVFFTNGDAMYAWHAVSD
jgi:hypothetical protein